MKSIVILDFGGQYAHLIASRVRRLGVYSEIREAETPASEFKDVAGIILSGGPQSVNEEGAPHGDPKIFELGIPVLGICYGLHWMTHVLGGEVTSSGVKEYGKVWVRGSGSGSRLFKNCPDEFTAWMSHGDEAVKLPEGFERIATSDSSENSGFANEEKKLFAIQFHPEVTHTECGETILKNFVGMCSADPWSVEGYADSIQEEIKSQVGDNPHSAKASRGKKVFMLVSGGVDSTVAFTLLDKVIGADRVQGLLVDTGLMRKDEVKNTKEALAKIGFDNLHVEDASELFFERLDGVYEPERKREIIGNAFLEVQAEVAKELKLDGPEWLLGQGTIYPDTIETGGTKHSDKIKTHHNRVEEVQKMIEAGRVIEPLKDLYKDEVRELGEILGLPHDLVWRHPFPGPGLGVRILCADEADVGRKTSDIGSLLPIKSVGVQGDGRTYRHALAVFSDNPCEVTEELWKQSADIPNKNQEINRVLKCTSHAEPVEYKFTPGFINRERADLLREADNIVYEEMHSANLYEGIWQFPVVLLPFGASEGQQSIVLRPIESIDAMTANSAHLPEKVLKQMTDRILSLDGIDVVFYDLTSKPPGTIEWE
ncbi:MAG: glutamine-hydrolyzing GMP synthase [Candidatus Peribacteraceae bacterium]|jgi:GMP synthase (glutamine-hydrolysing)|nr:glutamine-hydrolyzing GMP synthase [Candidatus Peribacteraceae bacterium]